MAHVYGSSPPNELEEYYDGARLMSKGFLGQSLIPSNDYNPAYTVYYLDGYYTSTPWVSETNNFKKTLQGSKFFQLTLKTFINS